MKPLKIADPARQEYRLTGIGCSVLSGSAFAIGTRNVSGGHVLQFSTFDPPRRRLTLANGEIGKLGRGMTLHLWSCAEDDNSPYEIKIAAIDVTGNAIVIDRDLNAPSAVVERVTEWIGAVPDLMRDETAIAAGDYCMAVGDYSFASGALTLATGLGAHAEGVLCEARGDMSFAAGSMCSAAGLAAIAAGTNTAAPGMFAVAIGSGNNAAGDSSLATGAGTECTGDNAAAFGFRTKAAGRCAIAAGALAEANADGAAAFGNSIKTAAKFSLIVGRHGELDNSVENQGAIAIAAGTVNAPDIPLLIRPNRAAANPLYPQEGEPKTLPEHDFSVTVAGHLLPRTVTAPGNILILDHGRAGRWKITPAAPVTPILKNWRDADRGELVIYNGGNKVLFPAAWRWIGAQVALKSAGLDMFTIYQIDEKIFIKHEVTA